MGKEPAADPAAYANWEAALARALAVRTLAATTAAAVRENSALIARNEELQVDAAAVLAKLNREVELALAEAEFAAAALTQGGNAVRN